MTAKRPDVGAMCCALMLVVAPFDVAIPEDGYGPFFIRPLMILIALLSLAAIIVHRDQLDPSLVRASALFVAALMGASAVSEDPDLGYAATLRIGVAVLAFLATSVSVTEIRNARILFAGAMAMTFGASIIGIAVLINDADLLFTDSLVGMISVSNGVARPDAPVLTSKRGGDGSCPRVGPSARCKRGGDHSATGLARSYDHRRCARGRGMHPNSQPRRRSRTGRRACNQHGDEQHGDIAAPAGRMELAPTISRGSRGRNCVVVASALGGTSRRRELSWTAVTDSY